MNVPRPLQLAMFCAALGLVSTTAAAPREVRMAANGASGACPDATAEDVDPAPQRASKPKASSEGKARATPMVRDGGDSTARPRWHSILPGMIR